MGLLGALKVLSEGLRDGPTLAFLPGFVGRRLLVEIAAHGGALQAVEHTGDLVVGRRATESDHAPATPA